MESGSPEFRCVTGVCLPPPLMGGVGGLVDWWIGGSVVQWVVGGSKGLRRGGGGGALLR